MLNLLNYLHKTLGPKSLGISDKSRDKINFQEIFEIYHFSLV